MSAYIQCPKCGDDSLDVDTLHCDCGYSSGYALDELKDAQARIAALESQLAAKTALCGELEQQVLDYREDLIAHGYRPGFLTIDGIDALLAKAKGGVEGNET